VSVAIGAKDAARIVAGCLQALDTQRDAGPVEILVATPAGDPTAEVVARDFPGVTRVTASARANLGELRGAAIAAARGDMIAITDPHCVVAPDWIAAIRRALASADVAGGVVENLAAATAADVAGYLFDYSAYAPPLAAGPTSDLTGNNIAYRRDVLEPLGAYARTGFLKYFVNGRLAAEGRRMVCVPDMRVGYARSYSLGRLARDRFHFGRCFAASRIAGSSPAFRAGYRAAAPLLPAIVIARLARRLLARPRYYPQVARAALPLALVGLAWGAGETAGAILGRGASCAEVY
jgi:hypothetical protein